MPRVFTHQSTFPATIQEISAFHARKEALRELTMPPLVLQVLRDERRSLTQGQVEFRLWFGPIPVRWLASHKQGRNPDSFTDVQLAGPMSRWEHEHIFETVPDGVRLTDRITFEHRRGWQGWLTRLFFDGILLRVLFMFRHWKTGRLIPGEGQR